MLRLRLSWAVTICALKWTFDMRLDSQTYSIYLTLTRRFTNDICFICVQVILISRSSEDLMFSKQLWWIPFYGTIKYFSSELNSTRAITQNVWNLLILLFFFEAPSMSYYITEGKLCNSTNLFHIIKYKITIVRNYKLVLFSVWNIRCVSRPKWKTWPNLPYIFHWLISPPIMCIVHKIWQVDKWTGNECKGAIVDLAT